MAGQMKPSTNRREKSRKTRKERRAKNSAAKGNALDDMLVYVNEVGISVLLRPVLTDWPKNTGAYLFESAIA
jgi:hypothetical protein